MLYLYYIMIWYFAIFYHYIVLLSYYFLILFNKNIPYCMLVLYWHCNLWPKQRKPIYDVVRKHLQKLEYFEKYLSPAMVVCNDVNDNHYPHNVAEDPKPYFYFVRKKTKQISYLKKRNVKQAQCFRILS